MRACGLGLAVPMVSSLYTCRLSAETISAFNLSATSRLSSVLPTAVGPVIVRNGPGFVEEEVTGMCQRVSAIGSRLMNRWSAGSFLRTERLRIPHTANGLIRFRHPLLHLQLTKPQKNREVNRYLNRNDIVIAIHFQEAEGRGIRNKCSGLILRSTSNPPHHRRNC